MRLADITGSPLNENEFLLDDFYIRLKKHDFGGNEFARSNESFNRSCTTTSPVERRTRNSCFFRSNNSRTINF